MATKERGQNPVITDDLTLRLFTYNSNARTDVYSINSVEIYFLDPEEKTAENPDGRRLVETIAGADVVRDSEGTYSVSINLQAVNYTIGKYLDVWKITVQELEPESSIEQQWKLYPNMWYTSPIPIVYDFSFDVKPNRIRQGSVKYLIVGIYPNVPKASDLERYYTNLAIAANLKISIEQTCGECLPAEKDLRLVVDEALIENREMCSGYYLLDTTNLDCGIYDVWFKMELGENIYISDKQSIEIFE
jgi:hypothetical protein